MRLHFISGLPRSGSTLLAGILRQNPRFHAAMTSPVGHIFAEMQSALSRKNEAAVFLSHEQKRALLRGVVANFYSTNGRGVIFDTGRMWCAKMPQIVDLWPDAKVICCVRDVRWIIDSIERLARRNPLELSGMFNFDAGGTVYSRVARIAASDGIVGYALDALREAYFGEHAGRLLLVDYEALTRRPHATTAAIYSFLDEDLFPHDFDNIEYAADDFDLPLGMPGLHTVRRKVEFIERETILPPGLFQRFENDAFWNNGTANPKGTLVIPASLPGLASVAA